MKKILSKITFAFILSIALITSLFVITSVAATVVEDVEWQTTINDDGNSVTITGVTVNSKKTSSFEIPETIFIITNDVGKEYPVTAIAKDAFIESADKIYGALTIPSTVSSIGDNAFAGTHISGDIVIPSSVISLGTGVFANCTEEITSIELSASLVQIPEKMLYNSNFTGTLSIPASVEKIGKNAFSGTNVKGELVIPYTLNTIDERAFESCERLTSLIIYNEPTSINESTNKSLKIGNYAFDNCTSITSITLGSGVTAIGNHAFASNTALKAIKYNAISVSDLSNTAFAFYCAGTKASGIELTVGRNVTEIPNCLLYVDNVVNAPRLTSISFEDGSACATIGSSAFANCYFLTNVKIADSVTKIGGSAFKACYSLTSVTLGTNVATIDSEAFKDCFKLIEVYNLSSKIAVTAKNDGYGNVGKYAIDVFTSLDEKSKLITTDDGFIMYEGDICYLLTYVGADSTAVFPDDCNGKPYEIYEYALYNYPTKISVVLSNKTNKDKKISAIAKYAFYGAPLTGDISITNSVSYIGEYAFSNCKGKITGLTLPKSITEIKPYTFENSYLVTNFSIPQGITAIGEKAFSGTFIYGHIEIPEGVTSLGNNAFHKCYGITSVKLPTTLKAINDNTFNECISLIEINVENVRAFGSGCFTNCQALLHVDFGPDVTSIGSEAFKECYSLSGKIDLSTVRSVNENSFRNCKRIDSFVLPNVSLNFFNFISGCTGLSAVYTVDDNPDYVSSDDGVLFKRETITDASNNETIIETLVFYPYLKEDKVYIVPATTTIIGASAFKNALNLEQVKMHNNITEIGQGAFANSSLKTAFVPDSIKKLNTETFANCSDLEWVVLGKNVSSITTSFANTTAIVYSRNEYLSRPSDITSSRYRVISGYQCVEHLYGYCDKAPTCEEYGYNQCTFCDKVAYVKELGHSGPIINKVDLSCTTDAYYEIDCIVCGKIEKVYTATSSGHKSNYTTTIMTSTTPGYIIGNCTVCHETYLATYTPHKEESCDSHTPTSVVITTASCKTNGLELIYCLDCGALIGEPKTTPKLACQYVFKSRIESTCTINGQIIEECSVPTCKNQRITTLDLAPHSHSWYTVSNNKGYEYSTCSVCGLFESNEVDYSLYDILLSQVSAYYKTYYAPDTVALLSPIMENRDLNLTQEAVDYNVELLDSILANVKYNVTDVPVVFIEKTDGELNKDSYTGAKLYVAYMDENGERQVEAVDYDGKIKTRGNATHNATKYPYNIKFSNKVDLFGMGAGKKYCLLANLYDQTLIRNAVVIEFAKSIGLEYTPNYTMVEVYYNGEYDGVYMLTTPIEVNENRIELDEEEDFLLEVENKNDAGLFYITNNYKTPDMYMHLLVESPEDMSAESYSRLISTFFQINIAIFSEDWEVIKEWIDVESVAKYYLLHEYLKEVDICWDSTRFYIKDGKLYGGPVWDFDFGLGNVVSQGGNQGSHSAYNNANSSYAESAGGDEAGVIVGDSTTGYWARGLWEGSNANGFFNELYMYSDEFIELVSQYVEEYDMQMRILYEDYKVDKNTTYTGTIDLLFYENDDFTSARIRNWQVYAVTGKYSSTSDVKISYNHAIDYLKSWLKRRHEWIISAYVETDARP
ncbi:MAG: leucine-rich repeat protein [Clostridia bacterium]|nr:leucine-rich repeat protein [Clostridia bacterium]